LLARVKEWFESEGYPLEFMTAHAFREAGFDVNQGLYVQDEAGYPREIDVEADFTADTNPDGFFRISQVVECKWSRDKPWVLFTSGRSIMAESACIAQAVGSTLGQAVLYCLAAEEPLKGLSLFRRANRGGFGGQRAFAKREKDLFYEAIQGVVSRAVARAEDWDQGTVEQGIVPVSGLIVFPVIVVDGTLLEAYCGDADGSVRFAEIDSGRVFWRGSTAKSLPISVVDVVRAEALQVFAKSRASDVKVLLASACSAAERIRSAFESRSFTKLAFGRAPRGFLGLPALLKELNDLEEASKGVVRER
jgi:hypothetical protein